MSVLAPQAAATRVTLPGGATLLHLPPRGPHAALAVSVGVGARDDAPHLPGTAHLVEHCVYPGRGDAEHVGAATPTGVLSGATTFPDSTEFHAAMPEEQTSVALRAHLRRLGTVLGDDDVIRQERNGIRHELAARGPRAVVDEVWVRHLRRHLPDEHWHDGYGTPESMDRIEAAELEGFRRAHYRRGSVVLAVASARSTAELSDWAEEALDGLPVGGVAARRRVAGTELVCDVVGDERGALASCSTPLGTRRDRIAAALVVATALRDEGIAASAGRHGILSGRGPDLLLALAAAPDPTRATERLRRALSRAGEIHVDTWAALCLRTWMTHRLGADGAHARVRAAARAVTVGDAADAPDLVITAIRSAPLVAIRELIDELQEALR